jgi:hypothetical protein
LVATIVMGAIALGCWLGLAAAIPADEGGWREIVLVAVPAAAGAAVYGGMLSRLGVDEFAVVREAILGRVRGMNRR